MGLTWKPSRWSASWNGYQLTVMLLPSGKYEWQVHLGELLRLDEDDSLATAMDLAAQEAAIDFESRMRRGRARRGRA